MEESQEKIIPDEYLDPVTRELFKDPVVASDSYTYERESLRKVMQIKAVSPLTNLSFKSTWVYTAITLRQNMKDDGFDEQLIHTPKESCEDLMEETVTTVTPTAIIPVMDRRSRVSPNIIIADEFSFMREVSTLPPARQTDGFLSEMSPEEQEAVASSFYANRISYSEFQQMYLQTTENGESDGTLSIIYSMKIFNMLSNVHGYPQNQETMTNMLKHAKAIAKIWTPSPPPNAELPGRGRGPEPLYCSADRIFIAWHAYKVLISTYNVDGTVCEKSVETVYEPEDLSRLVKGIQLRGMFADTTFSGKFPWVTVFGDDEQKLASFTYTESCNKLYVCTDEHPDGEDHRRRRLRHENIILRMVYNPCLDGYALRHIMRIGSEISALMMTSPLRIADAVATRTNS